MSQSLLSPYRALDLTDEKGFLCGRILGDFGVDVIKVEPPGGDPSRRIGPFYHDIPDPEKSLTWFAYNANKRGITLNIETADGRELFKGLVKGSDFVIESFPPGHLDTLGLGYETLMSINPRLILTSITPFGQTGPWKDFQGSDIALWALSSYMYVTGDEDRPPVWLGYPQSYLHAGLEAAAATLVAHYHRQLTGEGQWVDVSAQEALMVISLQNQQSWNLARFSPKRSGAYQQRSGVKWTYQHRLWPCKDGFVVFILFSGHLGAAGNKSLTEWMASEGLAPENMKSIDWSTFDPQGEVLTEDEYEQIMDALGAFFRRHTKAELYAEALKHRIVIYPCSTIQDLRDDPQL
ncbi:MAG: CoA transferase, partial [Chloroflexi bacterium]|nr:CoA transferase [Chloroflexota bacterium]